MKNICFRAISYLKYKKVKTFMLIGFFTILTSLSIFSVIINTTIDSNLKSLDNKNGISISTQTQRQRGDFNQSSTTTSINDTMIENIKKLAYVSDIGYASQLSITSSNITAITDSETTTTTNNDSNMPPRNNMNNGLSISGNNNLALLFENSDRFSLKEGTLPTDDNSIVISYDLAISNDLKVGSEVSINANSIDKKVKIVGIYETTSNSDMPMFNTSNQIYATYNLTKAFNTTSMRTQYTYYISDINKIEEFKTDYASITSQDKATINFTVNDDVYQNTIVPLQNLNNGIETARLAIIAIISVIIIILLVITTKERSSEVGVLYALSELKRNIVLQQLFEVVIVFVISYLIGVVLNGIIAGNVINSIMSSDIFNQVNRGRMIMGGGPSGMPSMPGVTTTTSINIDINALQLIINFSLMLAVVIIIISIIIMVMLRKNARDIINY